MVIGEGGGLGAFGGGRYVCWIEKGGKGLDGWTVRVRMIGERGFYWVLPTHELDLVIGFKTLFLDIFEWPKLDDIFN